MKHIETSINSKKIDNIREKIKLSQKNDVNFVNENEFIYLINYYITEKNIEEAINILVIALKYFPESKKILISESQIFIELGLYNRANKKLQKLLKQYPDDISIILLLGVNFVNSGIVNNSFYYFELAIKLANKELKSTFLYYIAQTFINSGRYDIAISYLKRAINLEPDNIDIMLDIAFSYEKINDYKNSLKFYLKSLKYDFFSKEVWFNIAIIYSKTKNFRKSIKAFNYALAVDPDFTIAQLGKINVLIKIKNYQRAWQLIEDLNDIDGFEHQYNYLKGLILFYKKNFKNAPIYLNKALELGYKTRRINILLVKCYFHTDIDKSSKIVFTALKKNKTNQFLLFCASKILHKKGKYKKALSVIKNAIKLQPYSLKFWCFATDIITDSGNPYRAAKFLSKAKFYFSENINFLIKLSSLYILSNQLDLAKETLYQAIKIDDNAIKKLKYIHPFDFDIKILID